MKIVATCLDCDKPYNAYSLQQVLATVCSLCLLARGLEDYQDWCGASGHELDPESADHYLTEIDYGINLPEWIHERIRRFADKKAA